MPPRRRPKSKAKVSEHSSDSAGDGIAQNVGSASTYQGANLGLSQDLPLTSEDQASTGADQGETRPESLQEALPPSHEVHTESLSRRNMAEAVARRPGSSPIELPAESWQAHRQELTQEAPIDASSATVDSNGALPSEIHQNIRIPAARAPPSLVSTSQTPATRQQSGSHNSQVQRPPSQNSTRATQQRQQQPNLNDDAIFIVDVSYFNMGQSEQQSEQLGMHIGFPRAQMAVRRFLAHPTMSNRRVLLTVVSRDAALGHGYEVLLNGPLQGAHYDILVRMRHMRDAGRRAF